MNEPLPEGVQALSAGGRLWRSVVDVNDLRPDELVVLEGACRQANLADRMEAEIQRDTTSSLVVVGSKGQDAPHPLLAELRMSRSLVAQSLSRLRLPDEPGITRARQRTVDARAAAAARWQR